MLQNLTGWHALLILAVIVLIFGAAKLPALARSFGQSVRILKDESRAAASDTGEPETSSRADDARPLAAPSAAPAAPAAPAAAERVTS
ncbi:twin-arginine translocase TatA/TatE family subunit [Microbacterium flavum]|uniref:Sec-independent protein translocase protein TatA n=1 Tax=Microbacterium flavum TaxID=415216 RepID=A0ABS5XTH5_9MICO|nr:twin-arginine translocase TatA/TatE family subunit [Microbacterium flavum]MBT8797833.1 twin-arginine translocase TatA/TatE family subunit [Microbacterium flavum]